MKINLKNFFNVQTIFCWISFIFILSCIIYYGTTFIKLYKDNQNTLIEKSKIFAEELKDISYEYNTLKKIKNIYYYNGNATNNYISYSNMLWRIVKINEDNSMLLISDNVIGTLAYGDLNSTYQDSHIVNWLNNNEQKNFMKILNTPEKYLNLTPTCTDNITNIEQITCNNIINNNYVGLLSIEDYLNTGGTTSFINNERYTYLSNKNEENKIWYIDNTGKIDVTDGTDILGIKPTITLLPTIQKHSGDGTIDNPYIIEDSNNFIGSYVKLDEDLWRIYDEKDGIIKLMLQDNIKDLKQTYSNNTYQYNDTLKNTLAYYLNNTYYNSLKYKDLIIENDYSNNLYGKENNYQYNTNNSTIKTKIAIPSIEDIIFNDSLNDYFTNTGKIENNEAIYIIKPDGNATTKLVTTESNIIPCISIKKEVLTRGIGSQNDPYRTEDNND